MKISAHTRLTTQHNWYSVVSTDIETPEQVEAYVSRVRERLLRKLAEEEPRPNVATKKDPKDYE